MKSSMLILLPLLALSACDTLEKNTARAGGDIQNGYDRTRQHVAKWIYDEDAHRAAEIPVVPPRYCYQAQMDVLCYSQPRDRLHNQLIGFQGDGAQSPDAYAPVIADSNASMNSSYTVNGASGSSVTTSGATIQTTDLAPPPGAASNNAPTTLMHGF